MHGIFKVFQSGLKTLNLHFSKFWGICHSHAFYFTAAFSIVDRITLISCLKRYVEIKGSTLKGHRPY